MARSRNIKPGLFKNEALGDCTFMERLLFIGLWTLADCNGKVEDRPRRIAIELFPYDSAPEMERALTSLCKAGFIDRYSADGVDVIQVVNFSRHQNPHKNEKASDLPEKPQPPENIGSQEKSRIIESARDKNGAVPELSGLLPITDSLLPITSSLNDDVIDNEKTTKDQSVNHSDLLNCFSDFSFPISYRNNPEAIKTIKSLADRGLSAEQFTEVIKTALEENQTKGLPSLRFIEAIADNVLVRSVSGIKQKSNSRGRVKEESPTERGARMAKERAELAQQQSNDGSVISEQ